MVEKMPWWGYVLMLPLALPAIVVFGFVINTVLEMHGG